MSAHRIGFAVKVLADSGLPSHDTRRWQSEPHLRVSLERLDAILDYLEGNDLRMYRMATAVAPYASHPDLPQFHGQIDECADGLERFGARARSLGIRLSTHPGQYTVLNSEREEVRRSAIEELEVQGALFEAMGMGPESVVVIHVGGTAGGAEAALDRFALGWEGLSDRARRYVAIENDDRSFGVEAVAGLARRCGTRVVWDLLHHHCHDPSGVPDREALEMALATWEAGVVPKVHFSSPRLDVTEKTERRGRRVERTPVLPQLRAHADMVEPIAFEYFMRECSGLGDFDVMVEAKAKDLAVRRLREQLAARGFGWQDGRLLVP